MKRFIKQSQLFRDARKNAGITQEKAAALIGWNKTQNVSNLERGAAGIPAKRVKRVAEVFGIKETDIRTAMVIDYSNYINGVINND